MVKVMGMIPNKFTNRGWAANGIDGTDFKWRGNELGKIKYLNMKINLKNKVVCTDTRWLAKFWKVCSNVSNKTCKDLLLNFK